MILEDPSRNDTIFAKPKEQFCPLNTLRICLALLAIHETHHSSSTSSTKPDPVQLSWDEAWSLAAAALERPQHAEDRGENCDLAFQCLVRLNDFERTVRARDTAEADNALAVVEEGDIFPDALLTNLAQHVLRAGEDKGEFELGQLTHIESRLAPILQEVKLSSMRLSTPTVASVFSSPSSARTLVPNRVSPSAFTLHNGVGSLSRTSSSHSIFSERR